MQKFLEKLENAIKHILSFLLIALVLVVSYIALMRNVFQNSPAWGEATALVIMVWFCLLSAAMGVMKGIHIRMTILDSFVSEKTINKFEHLTMVLWMVFGMLAFIYGISLTKIAGNNVIAGINLPASIIYSAIPVFGILVFVAALIQEVKLCQQA